MSHSLIMMYLRSMKQNCWICAKDQVNPSRKDHVLHTEDEGFASIDGSVTCTQCSDSDDSEYNYSSIHWL